MSIFLSRLGRWSFRARRLVVLVWAAVIVLLGAGAAAFASPSVTSFSLPGTESQEAMDLVEERFPEAGADQGSAQLVFEIGRAHV